MSTNDDRSLTPFPDRSLSSPPAAEPILSAMAGDAFPLGAKEAIAQAATFRIGDYTWCEPDYRQILLWAEALKMEPLTVIIKLVAGKKGALPSLQ